MGHDIGHLLLYAIGLVLTFNMGRDITLLWSSPDKMDRWSAEGWYLV
jgi:hypothetical protein